MDTPAAETAADPVRIEDAEPAAAAAPEEAPAEPETAPGGDVPAPRRFRTVELMIYAYHPEWEYLFEPAVRVRGARLPRRVPAPRHSMATA